MNSFPTSRRYARSLQEAFPSDYSNPIEGYKPYSAGTATVAFLLVFLAFVVVWSIF